MTPIKHLFSKDNRISVGDTVQVEYKGQLCSGKVMIADYSGNRYIVDIKMRHSDDVRSCSRKRHELITEANPTQVEDEMYDDDFWSQNMM